MTESREPESEEQTPPPAAPVASGPPASTPHDANEPPPPGLQPAQRPAKRWWSVRPGSAGPYDLLGFGIVWWVTLVLVLGFVGWRLDWWS